MGRLRVPSGVGLACPHVFGSAADEASRRHLHDVAAQQHAERSGLLVEVPPPSLGRVLPREDEELPVSGCVLDGKNAALPGPLSGVVEQNQ